MRLPSRFLRAKLAHFCGVGSGLAFLGVAFAQSPSLPETKTEIAVIVENVSLSTTDPTLDRVGGLRFLGGLSLRSADRRLGGLSGINVLEEKGDLRLVGVTDEGNQFRGRLSFADGRLRGLDGATIAPLLDLDGRPVVEKIAGDAESITTLPDGRVLIGFERRHRIWAYDAGLTGPATVFETPGALAKAPRNGGLESLASWPDGRILAITEQLKSEGGNFVAFLHQGGAWAPLEWQGSASGFEPSDAAVLPGGDLLVLERFWSAMDPMHPRTRIMRVKGDSVKTGAVLQGELVAELQNPLIAENFEGIATLSGRDRSVRLFLVSDDNFNRLQRTLLLSFELKDSPAPGSR